MGALKRWGIFYHRYFGSIMIKEINLQTKSFTNINLYVHSNTNLGLQIYYQFQLPTNPPSETTITRSDVSHFNTPQPPNPTNTKKGKKEIKKIQANEQ